MGLQSIAHWLAGLWVVAIIGTLSVALWGAGNCLSSEETRAALKRQNPRSRAPIPPATPPMPLLGVWLKKAKRKRERLRMLEQNPPE